MEAGIAEEFFPGIALMCWWRGWEGPGQLSAALGVPAEVTSAALESPDASEVPGKILGTGGRWDLAAGIARFGAVLVTVTSGWVGLAPHGMEPHGRAVPGAKLFFFCPGNEAVPWWINPQDSPALPHFLFLHPKPCSC